MKLYTRTGDTGTTGLFGGSRVPKDTARVEAYGTLDELNAALGFAAALLSEASAPEARRSDLAQIQSDLFRLGAELAAPENAARVTPGRQVDDADVARLEGWIDARETEVQPLRQFIVPGGTPAAAALHQARAVARRAERRVVTLSRTESVRGEVIRYLNRLSDLLFVMARAENARNGAAETPWRA
jgi:cob(I)alamin adenosyltransferase